MAFSDSMFLFEIIVEELKSFVNFKRFCIRCQFADVFKLNLNNPNDLDVEILRPKKKKKNKKKKVRKIKQNKDVYEICRTGQSILFTSNINLLRSKMIKYPMELNLCSSDGFDHQLGSTHIPWNYAFIEYLKKLFQQEDIPPANVIGEYNVFNEFTSKCMATIKLNVKLSHYKDKFVTEFRSLSAQDHKTFTQKRFNSETNLIVSAINDLDQVTSENVGTIKTIYSGGKTKKEKRNSRTKKEIVPEVKLSSDLTKKQSLNCDVLTELTSDDVGCNINKNIGHSKSDVEIDSNKKLAILSTKSCPSLYQNKLFSIMNYIFGDYNGPFGNQIYYVGYFTVENNFDKENSSKSSLKQRNSEKTMSSHTERHKLRVCDSECVKKNTGDSSCSQSICSFNLPQEASHLINLSKCQDVNCNNKKYREPLPPPDDRILLDLTNTRQECCDFSQKIEEVMGGMAAKMKFDEDKCYCSCECAFGFVKKTTYCGVCGGYEVVGEDLIKKQQGPFPCPIFHKLFDKNKSKTCSTSGSESKKKVDESQKKVDTMKDITETQKKSGVREKKGSKSQKSVTKLPKKLNKGQKKDGSQKTGRPKSVTSDKHSAGLDKSVEPEKDSKKGKKKKKDSRFQFNYGYQAPTIGHSQCVLLGDGSCSDPVPKDMGWLWNAKNIAGLKFRPKWKPGATLKQIVKLLKMAKDPGHVIGKKRRKDTGKSEKSLKRPLLVVHKEDGEYTVTLEPMKVYPKQRTLNQYPYADKPALTYTIGRTDEENFERFKKRQREQRRLERAQRTFIQSAFKDMCHEICLNTYQQALGFLPDTEKPDCPCYPAQPDAERTNMDVSCSCSEDRSYVWSDTDSDEWILEFTPPVATFDPTFKGKKVIKIDNSTQYTYLDFRVKLLDRYGNPVPRFFTGPDGKQQCSDLGGFWSPDHKWLEINVDGYVAPDGRWAPNNFIGPNGDQIDAETGKFQSTNGKWLVVGVDGYVDFQNRWRFYPRPKSTVPHKTRRDAKKGAGDKKDQKGTTYKPSELTWSCFGDVTSKQLSKMGIVGHGADRKLLLTTLQEMLSHGEQVTIPQPSTVPRSSKPQKGKVRTGVPDAERAKCRHPVPSQKGIVAVDT